MPTILRVGPYRLFFYSSDRSEPVHVHVQRDRAVAKFWVLPVALDGSYGFGRAELREIERIVEKNRDQIIRGWNEFFEE